MIENLRLAKEYGILTPEGMAELRRGKSATITKGEYAGQEAEADHVIPVAVCPEPAQRRLPYSQTSSLNSPFRKGAAPDKPKDPRHSQ